MSHARQNWMISVVVLFAAAGCGGGGGGTNNGGTPVTPSVNPTVTLVTVTPPTLSARPGDSAQQLTATATMSNASTQAVTTQATWTSSADQVATVTAGLVTPRAAGEAEIRATYQGMFGTARITVTAVPTMPGLSLSGRVREQGTSTGISGATVIIKDTPFTTVSDSSGNYSFTGLSAGNFVLRATKAGYQLTEVPVSLSANATLDISMPVTGPVAAFVVIPDPNTTATGEQCEVVAEGSANRLRCTFDATGSSAPGGITAYRWTFPVAGQPDATFSTARVERPTLPCGTFGSTGVTADRQVTLTITHAGGSTSLPRMITYRRNGPC